MRSSWVRVGPKSNDRVLIKDREGRRDTERRQRMEGCGHKPRNAWKRQKLKEQGRSQREPGPPASCFQTAGLHSCQTNPVFGFRSAALLFLETKNGCIKQCVSCESIQILINVSTSLVKLHDFFFFF